jgi:hypothetical protein
MPVRLQRDAGFVLALNANRVDALPTRCSGLACLPSEA